MARKTKEEAAQTRQAIMDTAVQVFLDKGYSSTSLSDIANAAGLTRGAIYWHFADKRDLFSAICDQVLPLLLQHSEQLERDMLENPAQALWRHSLQVLDTVVDNKRVRRIATVLHLHCEYVGELAPHRLNDMGWMQQKYRLLCRAFALAAQRGLLQEGCTPEEAACGLQALHRGLIQLWLTLPDCIPQPQTRANLLSPYFRGVFRDVSWLAEADAQHGCAL